MRSRGGTTGSWVRATSAPGAGSRGRHRMRSAAAGCPRLGNAQAHVSHGRGVGVRSHVRPATTAFRLHSVPSRGLPRGPRATRSRPRHPRMPSPGHPGSTRQRQARARRSRRRKHQRRTYAWAIQTQRVIEGQKMFSRQAPTEARLRRLSRRTWSLRPL
jgi:hypothetical protein